MQYTDLLVILDSLHHHRESERLEFKENIVDHTKIAETICALANSSCIKKQPFGYMIWGIHDKKEIVGTTTNIMTKKIPIKKSGSVNLRQWLQIQFKDQITIEPQELMYQGKQIRAIKIQAAHGGKPVLYNNIPYLRISAGDDAHNDDGHKHPDLLTIIYTSNHDATDMLTNLTISDLDDHAIDLFKTIIFSHTDGKRLSTNTDQEIFRKLGILRDNYITYGGALLLAQEDVSEKIFADRGQITRKYEDRYNGIVERKTWKTPLILHFDEIIDEIQRFNTPIGDTTLFRKDLKQYEYKALRELLFNAIVHRDWTINQRIEIIQTPKSIKFVNPGLFIANLDDVLRSNKRPDYRNRTLSAIFKSCKFIEKEGGGLRDVYDLQLKKGLTIRPVFETNRTIIELVGHITDIDFAKTVAKHEFDDVYDLVLLDKIVNGHNAVDTDIPKDEAQRLKDKGYIDITGTRYQKANLSKDLAKRIQKQGVRSRIKGLDKDRYIQLIIQHIEEYGSAKFDDIKEICKGKTRVRCSKLMLSMRETVLDLQKVPEKSKSDWLYVLKNKEQQMTKEEQRQNSNKSKDPIS